jgi:hypothetical protein
VPRDNWKDDAACLGFDPQLFFETYEENIEIRASIDEFCADCPLMRKCFAVGVSQKAYGVWGGVYLENGKPSREFNKHRTKQDWANTWQRLTIDKE